MLRGFRACRRLLLAQPSRSSGYKSRKSVEVLLTRDSPGLGARGDVLNVKPGFARHRLIPRGAAVRTVLDDEVAAVRAGFEAEDAAEREQLSHVVRRLESGAQLRFLREASKLGALGGAAVTAAEVAAALKQDFGIEVDAARVTPSSVSTTGEHTVTVHLGRVGLPAKVQLTVSSPAPSAAAS